jgi:hypothetical protein
MSETKLCAECKVPLMVSEGLKWDNNGVIPLALNPQRRSVFYESDVVDNLFEGIGELIGVPVDHMVIESRRRDVRRFIERTFLSQIEESIRLKEEMESEKDPEVREVKGRKLLEMRKGYNLQVNEIGKVYGYGNIQFSDRWEKDEEYAWRTQVIDNPHSMLFYPAEMLGSVEGFEQTDMRVEYEQIGDNTYAVSAHPGSHPVELKERLRRKRYEFKPGDIEFERCSTCSVPHEIARCRWDLEAGTIVDSFTGRRMAIYGPQAMEAVLDDLEAELGEVIPEAVIESQRRYIKSAWTEEEWRRDASAFRHLIAIRGVGNLTDFEGDRQGLTVTIQNSCLHLLMVGTIQALVETAYRVEDSTYEWDLADDGDLTVSIRVQRDESE